LDDLGIANNTIVVYTTDNGPNQFSWPDAATTPFRSEKDTNWEGAFRAPAMVRPKAFTVDEREHEAIVLKAREMHLGGATVLRGHIGFGHSSHIHTTKILRLSQDLPVVVEIVDSRKKLMPSFPYWMAPPTRCVCGFMHWPTISATSCARATLPPTIQRIAGS
jgi:PII-like signaling protein